MQLQFEQVMLFALVLPITQLLVFCVVGYFGLKLMSKNMSDMAELVDKLGEAFIEDRQTYRMIGELVKAEREGSKNVG